MEFIEVSFIFAQLRLAVLKEITTSKAIAMTAKPKVTTSICIVTVITIVMVLSITMSSIAIVNQVYITEIPVSIAATIAVASITRVAGSWGTGLHIAVSIGAENKRGFILVVQTIISTLSWVLAMKDIIVRGNSQSHEGCESNENLHVVFSESDSDFGSLHSIYSTKQTAYLHVSSIVQLL